MCRKEDDARLEERRSEAAYFIMLGRMARGDAGEQSGSLAWHKPSSGLK
jgi:hypothetical protein